MPFRHLLFNKRNGAPQRAPDAQPISLDSARYFSLDAEFPTYSWPEDNYTSHPVSNEYNPNMLQHPYLEKSRTLPHTQQLNQSSQHPYSAVAGPSYHASLYNLPPRSLSYSDLMDTDTSSMSRGSFHSSISSASHVDIAFDTDGSSLDSLSRKPSVTSSYNPDATSQALCPLLTGQVGRCSPNLCGPDAPCLQYVNNNYISSLEQCVPGSNLTARSNVAHPRSQPSTNTYAEPTPIRQQRQRSDTVAATSPDVSTTDSQQLTPTEESKGKPSDLPCPTSDITNAATKKGHATQNGRRSKARQAHSLVERKYRENLNAKIQELHLTLKRARFGRPKSLPTSNSQASHPYDEDDGVVDEMTDTEKSYKVKKSDVLVEAMDYVHATERELHRMQEEITQLKSHIRTMEGWMRPDHNHSRMPTHNLHQVPNR